MPAPEELKPAIGRSCYRGCIRDGRRSGAGMSRCSIQLKGKSQELKASHLKLAGRFAYGYCKAEKGVHRLVRISPFDSNAKRHTSFASVDVSPEVGDDIVIDLRMEDIRVDTYRASGAGGQHVNKTDSAVRMTHIPTGTSSSLVNERGAKSRTANRALRCSELKSTSKNWQRGRPRSIRWAERKKRSPGAIKSAAMSSSRIHVGQR
jgi:protein subunit release factor B